VNKKNNPPKRILVTAGPTIEPLDPVRFISNYSTGTMGYEIAREAVRKGHDTCLVTGPVQLSPPAGVEVVRTQTALEMRDRVMERVEKYDCVVMAAAVCDFRPEERKKDKIKKQEKMTLELVKNPDILTEVGKKEGLVKVGFALETGAGWLENAKEKLQAKNLDLIVTNVKEGARDPFGPGDKDFTIIDREGNAKELKGASKEQCAEIILSEVERLLG
jgi:phosphopantothenoylcysteine decarboxylase/phosphopantothenate--cysteine ligase